MKVIVELAEMKKALSVVKTAINTRGGALPVLSGVHLATRGDSLEVTGTDLDLTIQTSIDAEVIDDGRVLVSHSVLAKLVSGRGPVTLVADDENLNVVNGMTTSLKVLSIDDYPRLGGEIMSERFPLSIADLAVVVAAASSDDARPILTGVLFEQDGSIVATDSYRLHIVNTGTPFTGPVLVPARALAAVIGHKQPAWIQFGERDAVITSGSVRWSARLIEGQFPQYRSLIPSCYPNTAQVDHSRLAHAIGAVSAVVRDKSTPVRLLFDAASVQCKVITQEIGESTADVTCQAGGAIPGGMAVDPRYMTQALNTGVSDIMIISWIDALRPLTITDDGDDRYLRLLMPVRVS